MPNFFQQNPYGEAAAFGASAGNALSQGLLQLPQTRYELALNQANLQRELAQIQMMNQYRQGLLGVREQQMQNQQQGLDLRNSIANNANEIQQALLQLKMMQAAQPRVEGGYLIPGMGGQPPTPQGQPSASQVGLPNGIVPLPPRQTVHSFDPLASSRVKLNALNTMGMFNSLTNNPGLQQFAMNTASNIVNNPFGPTLQAAGQPTINALTNNPPNPQRLNATTNQVMTATNPTTGQRIRSIDGGNSWQPF